jgi:hypothetical protein
MAFLVWACVIGYFALLLYLGSAGAGEMDER